MLRIALLLIVAIISGGWTHGDPVVSPAVVCNIITGIATGVGAGTCASPHATCDGVADDTAAFTAFNTWATTTWQGSHSGQIELLIPPGANCLYGTGGGGSPSFVAGIFNVIIIGYGATLDGPYAHVGAAGQFQDSAHSVRLLAASVGATSVTVNPSSPTQPSSSIGGCATVAACAGLFTVGKHALIGGIDLQSGIGFPSNFFYFEYVLVTNVNTSTGVITFAAPLTNTYKTTWPQYGFGANSIGNSIDYGGPATLYAFNPGFDAVIEWRGLTFKTTFQTDADAWDVTFRGVTWTAVGNACVFPTQNGSFKIFNSSMINCSMEIDKLYASATVSNTTIDQIAFQTGSRNSSFVLNNSTVRNLVGTPYNLTMSGSATTSIIPGASTFGYTNTLAISNSSFASLANPGVSIPGGIIYEGSVGNEGVNNIPGVSMSGGVIAIPNAYVGANEGSIGWASPGGNNCWADAVYLCAQLWQVSDVTQDGSVNNTVTISHASPAVIGLTAHGRVAGDVVSLTTPGSSCLLPAPLVCGTLYYVIAAGLLANSFEVSATSGGAAINTTTNGTGPFTAVTGNTYVHTSQAGGFPSWTYANGKLFIQAHPALQFTCTNCSGGILTTDLNNAPAGAPLYSYSKRIWNNAASFQTGVCNETPNPCVNLWGAISKITATVTVAYAGASNPQTDNLTQTFIKTSDLSAVSYVPIINLRVASATPRVLDVSGGYPAAWTGAQSGDTLPSLAQATQSTTLLINQIQDVSSDPSHPFSATVEVITNQGVVLPP